jgi:hypothetical protein
MQIIDIEEKDWLHRKMVTVTFEDHTFVVLQLTKNDDTGRWEFIENNISPSFTISHFKAINHIGNTDEFLKRVLNDSRIRLKLIVK